MAQPSEHLQDVVALTNCDVVLYYNAQEFSGGHLHNTNRPAGNFQPSSGNTGSTGLLSATYTAPEASGLTEVTAAGVWDGFPVTPELFSIGVEYDGLISGVSLSLPGLQINSASNMHGNNNGWGLSAMFSQLESVAQTYPLILSAAAGAPVQAPVVQVTAVSLPLGGLFDFQTEWSPPHVAHRFGNNADVGLTGLGNQFKRALAVSVQRAGFTTPVPGERPSDPNSNHWHLVY